MIRLKAHAKINLSLKIIGRRPDGYHDLESVMQSVSLHDLISLEPLTAGISLASGNELLPNDNRNLAYKAAELFLKEVSSRQKTVSGIKVHIQKNIPIAAGLAGGSADAAAVLYGLNKMAGEMFTQDELMALGAGIGSDVPFCLAGGNRLVKGRGEKIESNPSGALPKHYIIVVPPAEVSTKWAYEEFDRLNLKDKNRDQSIMNDLEAAVIPKYPQIQAIKDKLVGYGCSLAQMSGSGASVFGEVGGREKGEKIVSLVKKEYPQTFLVETVGRGIEEA